MRSILLQTAKAAAVYFLLCLGTLLMLRSILRYTAIDDHVGFLNFKQGYLHIGIWKAAFYTHVFSSLFTLLAGFSQFSREVQRRYPRVHRVLGRLYVIDVLLINVPAGFIMAIYANGGVPSKCAFLLLDGLWAFFTWKAYATARQGAFRQHRNYMIRSYALTLSALCLRGWKLFFVSFTSLDIALVYQIDAWLGFVPNLLLAEWIIRRNTVGGRISAQKPSTPATRVQHPSAAAGREK